MDNVNARSTQRLGVAEICKDRFAGNVISIPDAYASSWLPGDCGSDRNDIHQGSNTQIRRILRTLKFDLKCTTVLSQTLPTFSSKGGAMDLVQRIKIYNTKGK